jgi:anthranilate/para-aminobenzoate synthase component II
MKKNKTLFLDFHDSFSLNIVSEFYRQGHEIDTLNFEELCAMDKIEIQELFKYRNLILGPGPGHPDDYLRFQQFKDLLINFYNNKERFILGVCLGHQILGNLLSFEVIESNYKKHGESVEYQVLQNDSCFPKDLYGKVISVQRYNSLTLRPIPGEKNSSNFIGLDENNEVLCLRGENFISYQFHPESIGTIYREEIFLYLVKCLYN